MVFRMESHGLSFFLSFYLWDCPLTLHFHTRGCAGVGGGGQKKGLRGEWEEEDEREAEVGGLQIAQHRGAGGGRHQGILLRKSWQVNT
jgi:hypothetical protein